MASSSQPAGVPSEVGFRFRLQHYTPESPCAVPGQFVCTREDERLWLKHAEQWVAAISQIASTASNRATVEKMARQVHEIDERNCWIGCGSGVEALVAICQHAKLAAESWGRPVDGLEDEWGWEFPIPWGWPNWLKDAKKKWDTAGALLGLLPFAVIGLLLLNNRRKGSWL